MFEIAFRSDHTRPPKGLTVKRSSSDVAAVRDCAPVCSDVSVCLSPVAPTVGSPHCSCVRIPALILLLRVVACVTVQSRLESGSPAPAPAPSTRLDSPLLSSRRRRHGVHAIAAPVGGRLCARRGCVCGRTENHRTGGRSRTAGQNAHRKERERARTSGRTVSARSSRCPCLCVACASWPSSTISLAARWFCSRRCIKQQDGYSSPLRYWQCAYSAIYAGQDASHRTCRPSCACLRTQ